MLRPGVGAFAMRRSWTSKRSIAVLVLVASSISSCAARGPSVPPNNLSGLSALGPSLLSFIPELKDAKTGRFDLELHPGVFEEGLSGSFAQRNGIFYSVGDVDTTAIAQKVEALRAGLSKHSRTAPLPVIPTGDGYQLDVEGFLVRAMAIPDLGFISDYLALGNAADKCPELPQWKATEQRAVAGLKPNYVADSTRLQTWTLDASAFTGKLNIGEKSSTCSQLFSADEGTKAAHYSLTFRSSPIPGGAKLEVTASGTEGYDLPQGTVLSLKVTEIDTASPPALPGEVFSAFSRYAIYASKIDECKTLPIIATNFAAANSYDVPGTGFYEGPTLFDSDYFCSEKQAQDAGYSKAF